jgi:DNA topoisomerase-1
LITKHTALKELRQQSRVTGRFTNITDDEIEEAKNEPPPNGAGLLPGQQAPMKEEEGEPAEDPNERLGPENPDVDENETTGDSGKWFKFKDFVKMFKSAFKAGFDEESFEESKHPRENDGKFAPKGAGGGSSKPSVKLTGATKVDKDGKRVTSEGKPLPEHIASLKIPPAWTDVTYSPDPKSELLAKGKDSKGRDQYVYSEEHKGKAAEAKFSRIDELNEKYEEVLKQNMGNLKGPKAEVAQVLHLIMQTGIRPGGDDDTQAKVKAYGATTLEGRHVKQKGKAVYLEFIGKKGVPNSIPIEDSYMARVLLDRAKKVGGDGRLFNVDNVKLLGYSESLDGGGFKTKDFRTLLGTRTAMEQVKKEKPPSNEKEYKKKVKLVAKYVSQKLGNTPSVALKAYIHPVVFQGWRSTIS